MVSMTYNISIELLEFLLILVIILKITAFVSSYAACYMSVPQSSIKPKI